MGVERALGVARRAGSIDDHGRVVGPRVHRLRRGPGRRFQGGPKIHPLAGALRLRTLTHDDQRFQFRKLRQDLLHQGQGFRLEQEGVGAAVPEPEQQGIPPEQDGERHRDGAQFVDGQVGKGRLRPLRHQHRRPAAALKPPRGQHARQFVGKFLEGAEGKGRRVARFVLVEERLALRQRRVGRVAVAHVGGDVEGFGDLPAEGLENLVVALDVGGDFPRSHIGDP